LANQPGYPITNQLTLSSDTTQDYANFVAAWQNLPQPANVTQNDLLTYPTGGNGHPGGQMWAPGGTAYTAMETVLNDWAADTAAGSSSSSSSSSSGGTGSSSSGSSSSSSSSSGGTGCGSSSSGSSSSGSSSGGSFPLLGSAHGGHVWNTFCANQPDSTPLPADPRTLVVPGVNQNKAVNFNAYWKSCGNPSPAPTTCGQLRQKQAAGLLIGEGQGQAGSATMFGGSSTDTLFAIPASVYNNAWKSWGMKARPAQFDQLLAERFGSPLSPGSNPYPLPGEDPNQTSGGSGQLPLVFTQLRNADGSWTGKIGVKFCAMCHNGQLGTAADGPGMGPQYGGAGSISDFEVAFRDLAGAGMVPFAPLSILNIANGRGAGAIDQFQLGFILFGLDKPATLANPKILFSQAIGTIKSPAWWNMGHRPQKFHGAILPMDASRIDMAAYYPLQYFLQKKQPIDWVDANDTNFQSWAESLNSPQWPYGYCSNADGSPAAGDNPACINTPLAEQGAILFHSKNLWDASLNNPVPAPPTGNGSCASCHGAYSPQFVNNPDFLDTPALEGVAAYFVPSKVIATDPIYASSMQSLKNANGTVSPVILENDFLYCGLGDQGSSRDPGMLAPPLYGVWAAAPYLHNGSVPNVWGVLKPTDRPKIWERVSTPAPAGLEGKVVMGYDTNLQRAYDTTKLGWDYSTLSCGQAGTQPYIVCSPSNPQSPAVLQQVLGDLYKEIALLWNLPLPQNLLYGNEQIERRKIYNTYEYSQGNQGHEFTSVLTDQERAALIEYLKTL
ncbi:MAG: hypothetical protein P4L83_12790, partial [Nevskia sp.]|nr:hypothetical protein [Nevskia sp.]